MNNSENLNAILENCNSKAEAQNLLDSWNRTGSYISIHTTQGNYINVSATCAKITGHTEEELKGTTAYDYFHPEDMTEVLKSHAYTTLKPDVFNVKYRFRKKDHTYVEVVSFSKQVGVGEESPFILAITYIP